jgi:putative nucleotidyltransferase with HDIG domain
MRHVPKHGNTSELAGRKAWSLPGYELADFVSDWVGSLDVDGAIRHANQPFGMYLGGHQGMEEGTHLSEFVDGADRVRFTRHLESMWKSGSETDVTVRMIALSHSEMLVQWRIVPVPSSDGAGPAAIAIGRDVSELHLARKQLQHRLDLEVVLSNAAINLATNDAVAPREVMAVVGQAIDVDRVYIFEIRSSGNVMDNTYEWCAQTVQPEIAHLQGLSVSDFPWWMDQLRSGRTISISNVAGMPESASAEREILQAQKIRSVLAFPLASGTNQLTGFIGLDSVRRQRNWGGDEIRALSVLARMIAVWQERSAAIRRSVLLQESLIETLSRMTELQDPYTYSHQRQVAQLCRAIAEKLGLDERRTESLYLAGMLHDIGKLAIPANLLAKPGLLSDEEMALVRTHVENGYSILSRIPFDAPIADIVLQHHERLDGSGYPNQLRGEQIRLTSRILAVADVVEAIMHHRPYRAARGLHSALDVLAEGSGTAFDPNVVAACYEVLLADGFAFAIDSRTI